jgi:hypothetical protein
MSWEDERNSSRFARAIPNPTTLRFGTTSVFHPQGRNFIVSIPYFAHAWGPPLPRFFVVLQGDKIVVAGETGFRVEEGEASVSSVCQASPR